VNQRQVANLAIRATSKVGEMCLGLFELSRVGALKSEDRLLVVANREECSDDAGLGPLARIEFTGNRLDDVPLPRVGILCFIDKDMVRRLIKLVADPVTDAVLCRSSLTVWRIRSLKSTTP
jgi:hypothetical protein